MRIKRTAAMVLTFCAMVLGWGSQALCHADEDTLIAVADGFEVRKSELDELARLYSANNFTSTEAGHRKALVRVKLFAAEAKKLNLKKDAAAEASDTPKTETMADLLELSRLYFTKISDEYPLDNAVIESYYYAHPETFCEECDINETHPLDDERRIWIRTRIMTEKRKMLADDLYETLMAKYNVRFCESEEGCK